MFVLGWWRRMQEADAEPAKCQAAVLKCFPDPVCKI